MVPEDAWQKLESQDDLLDRAAQALAALVEEQDFERRIPFARAVLEAIVVAVARRMIEAVAADDSCSAASTSETASPSTSGSTCAPTTSRYDPEELVEVGD